MAAEKSPACHGLPAEFFKEVFPNKSPIIIKMVIAQREQPLARSQQKGTITLLPKKILIPAFSVSS
jgi:hypothetical protein